MWYNSLKNPAFWLGKNFWTMGTFSRPRFAMGSQEVLKFSSCITLKSQMSFFLKKWNIPDFRPFPMWIKINIKKIRACHYWTFKDPYPQTFDFLKNYQLFCSSVNIFYVWLWQELKILNYKLYRGVKITNYRGHCFRHLVPNILCQICQILC